jgi:hypothetical protein
MAIGITLARTAKLYIATGDPLVIVDRTTEPTGLMADADFIPIEHITSLGPTRTEATRDTTDFDDAGEDSSVIVSRGQTFALSYNYYADPATGARPPGQEALEALADEIGAAGIGQFMYEPYTGGDVRIFNAHVSGASGPGGGTNEVGTVSATLTKTGQFYVGTTPTDPP